MKAAVLDTGVLVAGIFWRHEPHRCVQAWLHGLFTIAVSEPIFTEYERMLREVKAEQGFTTGLAPWLEAVRTTALWATPDTLMEPVCRDPKDDIMIEAALAAGARTIIARDAHGCSSRPRDQRSQTIISPSSGAGRCEMR